MSYPEPFDGMQIFENLYLSKMIDVKGDNPAVGTQVTQYNGNLNPAKWNNAAEQWTAIDNGEYRFGLTASGNAHLLTNSGGLATMETAEAGLETQAWIPVWTPNGYVLACADGTGCLTGNANGTDSVQLTISPYAGNTTQFWCAGPVSAGVWPQFPTGNEHTVTISSALCAWLGATTGLAAPSPAEPTYVLGDALCELYRLVHTAFYVSNTIDAATFNAVNGYVMWWLYQYDGSYRSAEAKQTIENGFAEIVDKDDWGAGESDLDTDGYTPPLPEEMLS